MLAAVLGLLPGVVGRSTTDGGTVWLWVAGLDNHFGGGMNCATDLHRALRMSDVGRVLWEVGNFAELLALLRARVDELNVSREVLDDLSGLQPGYSSKILSGMRGLGRVSLGCFLGAIGCRLQLVVDEQASAPVRDRWTPRAGEYVRTGHVRHKPPAAAEPIDHWAALRRKRSA